MLSSRVREAEEQHRELCDQRSLLEGTNATLAEQLQRSTVALQAQERQQEEQLSAVREHLQARQLQRADLVRQREQQRSENGKCLFSAKCLHD